MSKIQVTDEFLYQQMPELEEKLLNEMPDEQEIDVEFTEEFQKEMEVILSKVKKKEKHGLSVTIWRWAAAIIIVSAVGMTMSLNAEAIRDKLYEVLRIEHDTYVESRYSIDEGDIGKFVPMYPEYIPEGYKPDIQDQDDNFLILYYKNADGYVFFIQQTQITDGLVISTDNEYISEKNAVVLGKSATIHTKENGIIMVQWNSEECEYMVCAEDLEEQEVLKICNSLKIE